MAKPLSKRKTAGAQPPTGLVYDDICLRHDTGPGHPEQPGRLTAIMERLRATGLLPRLKRIPRLQPEETLSWIEAIHAREYIGRVRHSCAAGAGCIDTPDVPVCGESYEAAVAAAGGALAAAEAVMTGAVRNAFAAVRPPGHHALARQAMGFCLFNNVAIAARYLREKHGLGKILIVDWDVHHGNGTQDAFYEDPSVFYFSVHRYPFYPGTGSTGERGAGNGRGATLNAPLAMGSGDRDFADAFMRKLLPAAKAFAPDFVLASAGFDAHERDPLGGMACTAEGYGLLTRMTRELAREFCSDRFMSVLEGGYDPQGLAESVEQHVRALIAERTVE
ncbi:MAG: histone deacetylase [Verrucomicrobiota bacterium]|nr:histone deacetylase [Verrucomicrobiota bacterium]